MFKRGWAVRAKEQRILVGSDFFKPGNDHREKSFLCLVTHSYSDKLVLRRYNILLLKFAA